MKYLDGFGPIIPARLSGCFLGGSGGSSSGQNKSQQGPVENPAFPMLRSNVQRATGVADMPFQSYDANSTVAPSNPSLNNSWDMFNNIGANNTGGATMGSAIDTTKGIAGFHPGNITAGSLPRTDLSAYMNPFQKNVTDTTMADLERQRQIQRVSDNQATTAGGSAAFSGSRAGVADSLTNDAYFRTAGKTLADLNLGNFNNAQGMATSDLNRALSADTSNQGAGIAGAGLRLNAGSQLGAMSDQELQQALTRAGAANTAGTQQRTIQQQLADAAYREFMRQIMQPYQGQQLINASMGLLPGGVSQAGTSSGNQNASNFGFQIL